MSGHLKRGRGKGSGASSSSDSRNTTDRHKTRRIYESGSEKRKISTEREEKFKKVVSKMPKMEKFFTCVPLKDSTDKVKETTIADCDDVYMPMLDPEGDVLQQCSSEIVKSKVETGTESIISASPATDISTTADQNNGLIKDFNTTSHGQKNTLSMPKNDGEIDSRVDQSKSAQVQGNSSDLVLEVEVSQVEVEGQASKSFDGHHSAEEEEIVDVLYDIGLWGCKPSPKIVSYWVKSSQEEKKKLQNCDTEMLESKSVKTTQRVKKGKLYIRTTRKCQKSYFERKIQNKEKVLRWWLCFSPHEGKLFCLVCKLFSEIDSSLSNDGYCDWTHAHNRLSEHENSKEHVKCLDAFIERGNSLGKIDYELMEQEKLLTQYWVQVLTRVVRVIKFIAERNLSFRGDDEKFGSRHNGNYLGILELLAQNDEFLAEHIRLHGNKGSGHPNYLSSTICEEIIRIMGDRVRFSICEEIRKSKYYSVSVDSTPDEARIDQLSVVIQNMDAEFKPKESFLTFLPNRGHTGAGLASALLKFLEEQDISIDDCRGQSYDNAANMSGKYNGMQANIKEKNNLAVFVPCCAYSLNLVGKEAAKACTDAVRFFEFIQHVYVFLSASTERYNILMKELGKGKELMEKVFTVKSLSETRWSCRADATRALVHGYEHIKDALEVIANDVEEKALVRDEASKLLEQMCSLENAIYLSFWDDILERFNATSKYLQHSQMSLRCAVESLESLQSYVLSKRDSFDDYEERGKQLSGTEEYSSKPVRNRKNPRDAGKAPDTVFSKRESFRIKCFLPVIDSIVQCLSTRMKAYEEIYDNFGFLGELTELSDDEIKSRAQKLRGAYPNDLDEYFGSELQQFAQIVKKRISECDKSSCKELFFYQFLMDNNIQCTFPNTEIALRMYLVLMVTNCSTERSFSKLKIIKNRLRTTMAQDRLCSLSLLSIESEVMNKLDFSDIILDFAKKKARKVYLHLP